MRYVTYYHLNYFEVFCELITSKKIILLFFRIQRDLDLCFVEKEIQGIPHHVNITNARNTDSEREENAISPGFQLTFHKL